MAATEPGPDDGLSLPYAALDPDETSQGVCTRAKKQVKRWAAGGVVLVALVLVGSVVILSQNYGSGEGGISIGRVLHLSDFHYDPIYVPEISGGKPCTCNRVTAGCENSLAAKNAPYGRKGCDSPMKLIKSVLQAAGSAVKSPDLIVSTGDVVRHHSNILTEKNRLYRMFEEVFSAILAVYDVGTTKTAFHLPLEIAQTYGNDDFENNYFFNATSRGCDGPAQPLMEDVPEVLAKAMRTLDSANNKTLRCAGYYIMHVSDKFSVVVLNTVLYSTRHKPAYPADQQGDPMGQFAWLRAVLGRCREEKRSVWVVGHIAPGYDSFEFKQMWSEQYTASYIDIISAHHDVVKGQLYGHEHLNTYRLFEEDTNIEAPIILSGSVSPIFGNAPSFRVIEYDKETFEILDVVSYGTGRIDEAEGGKHWKERFRFNDVFKTRSLSSASLRDLTERLGNDEKLMRVYHFRKADTDTAPWPKTGTVLPFPGDKHELCAMKHLQETPFGRCLGA